MTISVASRHAGSGVRPVGTARAFARLLVIVHAGLAIWALVGFAEWFAAATPWPAISNPLFPREVLFLQWALVLLAAALFIGGYLARWFATPVAMSGVYLAMAALCAVETIVYLESDLRFLAMALEYAAYAAILIFLFRSSLFRSHPA